MKRILQILMLAPVLALVLHACRPLDYKSVGLPKENINTLFGTWKLTKVTQTDEESARKGFPFQTLDLTSTFQYTDFKLTFNGNGSTATTFATTPGNSPKIIKLASGNWTVDDPSNPKVITLANATDTSRITLGSYPIGITPVLKVKLEKRDPATGKLFISYSYEFTKQ
jgi:hypothetical protein